jgi:hypothetical protein
MTIQVGDRVQFSRKFLKNISRKFLKNTGQHTGDVPFAKGKVIKLTPFGSPHSPTILATVEWDTPDVPVQVNIAHLHKIGEVENA